MTARGLRRRVGWYNPAMAQLGTPSQAATLPERFRFRRAEYYRMAEAGIIGADDRVELLDGEVVRMSPIGYRHALVVDRLAEHFSSLRGRATVRIQNPIVLNDHSEPEPDVALLLPESQRDLSDHPSARDVLLVVEVADNSLYRDRHVKVPLYAAAGVREVWLIDLAAETLTVHLDPQADRYTAVETVDRSRGISPRAFPDLPLSLSDLLR